MLKPKTKRISKQELKEDKFVKTTLQVKSYMEENYRQVITVVGTFFAILVLFILYNYVQQETRAEANAIFGMAQIEFTNGEYAKASLKLTKLINEYDGTVEAEQGLFLLANINFQQKRYDEAEKYFDQFIDSYSGSDILIGSAYAGLAACKETHNKYEEAADLYVSAADMAPDFTESDNYIYLAGICYKKAGKIENAVKQFKNLTERETASKLQKDAEVQLALLKQ